MISSRRLWQVYAAFASGFGCFMLGMLTVWSSYVSPLYSSNSTTLLSEPMTKLEDSLLGSVPSLGCMVGTTIAANILDTYGRRNGGILLSLPFLISWAIIGISPSIKVILVARFLGGISGGVALIFAPILVSEVSEDSIRGFLASVSMFQYNIGILFSYIIGWCFSYRVVIWINIACSVICTGLLMFMEESPVHLIRKRKFKEAKLSISRYRGIPVSAMLEMDELLITKQLSGNPAIINNSTRKFVEAEKLQKQDLHEETSTTMSSFKMLFWSASSRRAFLVVITLMTLLVFMGVTPIQVYANVIFAGLDSSNSDLYTVIFAIVQVVAAIVTATVADKFGRRLLQIGSSVIVTICLAALAYMFQFKAVPFEVIVVLIMVYSFFYMVGAGSIPYVLVAEVFAPEVINLASLLVIEWMWFLNFVSIAIFPYMVESLGIYGSFYVFGAVSAANAIFSYYCLPETAGLSNAQIRKLFVKRNWKK